MLKDVEEEILAKFEPHCSNHRRLIDMIVYDLMKSTISCKLCFEDYLHKKHIERIDVHDTFLFFNFSGINCFHRYWTSSHRECTTFMFIDGDNLFPVAIPTFMFSISFKGLLKKHIILLTIQAGLISKRHAFLKEKVISFSEHILLEVSTISFKSNSSLQ